MDYLHPILDLLRGSETPLAHEIVEAAKRAATEQAFVDMLAPPHVRFLFPFVEQIIETTKDPEIALLLLRALDTLEFALYRWDRPADTDEILRNYDPDDHDYCGECERLQEVEGVLPCPKCREAILVPNLF